MPMRSRALLILQESYSHVLAARIQLQNSPGPEAQDAVALAEQDFMDTAEEAARMVPLIVPAEHKLALEPWGPE